MLLSDPKSWLLGLPFIHQILNLKESDIKLLSSISLGRKVYVFYISESGKGNRLSCLCVRWLYNCSLSFYVVISVEALNAHLNLWLVPDSSLTLDQARQTGEVTPGKVVLLVDILLRFAVSVAYSAPSHCVWIYLLTTWQGLSVLWNALLISASGMISLGSADSKQNILNSQLLIHRHSNLQCVLEHRMWWTWPQACWSYIAESYY